jgi:hypothetical protein
MRTSKSPWTVMRWAHELGRRTLRPYASKFSRRDFTLAQLFACPVLREMLGLSFRDVEAVLRDADWCQRLGMRGVPDHSTLCRAFKLLVNAQCVARMLDLVPHARGMRRKLGRTLAVDSTLCETHHRSRHYERRCRHHATSEKRSANARRSRSAKRTPKLSIGVDTRTHLILSAKPKTGMGSDAPDFHDALYDAWTRHDVKVVLADAGYDSEANHRLARLDMNVRSLIKATAGRPTTKAASGDFRRQMQRQLSGSQKGKPYGQRAQVECVMSMLKRNLGDALRARTTHRRKMELLLKVLTHNLMIIRRPDRGSQRCRSVPKDPSLKVEALPPREPPPSHERGTQRVSNGAVLKASASSSASTSRRGCFHVSALA